MLDDFRVIDAHIHVLPQWAELAVRVMDRCNIECSVNMGWMDAFGARLKEMLKVFSRYPGRFVQLGNIDWKGIDSPKFGKRAADGLEASVEAGARGLKIFKSLGLELRGRDGELIRVDDRRLDPVFERAGILGVPVLIHTADPSWFWKPIGPRNFWSGVLEGEYASWSYYRKGLPSREELLAERDNLIERHRDTVFVLPHLASLEDDPLAFAETLEAYPNVYADISARLPIMVRTETRKKTWRDILIKYADRIVFGTDLIYLDKDVATGIQSQSFQRPEDVNIAGMTAEEAYEMTSYRYVLAHVRFLATSELQEHAPFRRQKGTFPLPGLGLPEEVLDKILCQTPSRVYGLS